MKIDDFFIFGKYEDHPLREIIEKDSSYVRWAISQNIIGIDEDAVDILEMEE